MRPVSPKQRPLIQMLLALLGLMLLIFIFLLKSVTVQNLAARPLPAAHPYPELVGRWKTYPPIKFRKASWPIYVPVLITFQSDGKAHLEYTVLRENPAENRTYPDDTTEYTWTYDPGAQKLVLHSVTHWVNEKMKNGTVDFVYRLDPGTGTLTLTPGNRSDLPFVHTLLPQRYFDGVMSVLKKE